MTSTLARTPVQPETVALVVADLEQLCEAMRRVGNDTAVIVTRDAIRTIRGLDELVTVQGALIDALVAQPRRWAGSFRRNGRKARR